jgi:hypothetical protein
MSLHRKAYAQACAVTALAMAAAFFGRFLARVVA